eukprot:37809_1
MDFKKLVRPLSEYYGLLSIQEATKSLEIWYENEAYDDADIVTDWNPDAFTDSEGIGKLIEFLKYPPPLQNEEQKRILYSYCCYYLLSDQKIPNKQLIKHITESHKPLQQIKSQFQKKLMHKIHIPRNDATDIAQHVLEYIEEQEYDIEGIEDDLDNINESEIIDNLIETFPNLQQHSNKIFDILLSVVTISNEVPDPINDSKKQLTLTMYSSDKDKDEFCSLDIKYLKGVFGYLSERNSNPFVIAKSWDIYNEFPWLLLSFDTFSRFCVDSHKKTCNESKNPEKTMSDDKFCDMTPKEWFEQYDSYTRQLIQKDSHRAGYLCAALMEMDHHFTRKLNMNYKIHWTILDSFSTFAMYSIAINEFIYGISNSSTFQCTPIQFDFMIIPKCVSEPMYQDSELPGDDFWAHVPSFMRNINIKSERYEPKIMHLCTGYCENINNDDSMNNYDDNTGCIWDIETDCLIKSG